MSLHVVDAGDKLMRKKDMVTSLTEISEIHKQVRHIYNRL